MLLFEILWLMLNLHLLMLLNWLPTVLLSCWVHFI